ncbi:MAG TPA: HAMP domain-containing sensor histidine kinase [Rhodocyclaceae bacterium]
MPSERTTISALERLQLWLTPVCDDQNDASLLVAITLITLPFALLYVAVSQWIGYRHGVVLMSACFLLLAAILLVFRATGRFRLCANLYLANCAIVAIFGCAFFSGGIHSMVLPWIALVPITSVLLLGISIDTVLWTCFAGSAVVGLGWAAMAGAVFTPAYDTRHTDFFNTMCIVGLSTILSGIALAFARNRSRALATIEMALRRLAEARDEALAANLAKSRFLAAASHDLRQPVQAIGLFQTALQRTPLSEEQHAINSFLRQAANNLGDILNALLDISRLDSGAIRSDPERIDPGELLGKLEPEFSALALARGLRFKLFRPAHELVLFTDARLLQLVLRNLVDNAIKYTERGGVLIGVRRRGDRALIQVWDTGKGIAPEHMESIFEEYMQVDNRHRDLAQGLGLGLAIARRISGVLGSDLVCRSRLGRGSVFEVSVPLAA